MEVHGNPLGESALDEATQLALVRRFEPVIRYVRGELFFPMSVEDYLMPSRLVAGSTKDPEVLADRGHLTPDSLAALGRAHSSRSLSIQHVESPLSRAAYAAWRRRPDRERFRASSRFAAVGMPSRLIDVGLRLTLLLRGRVPGGFTAAAHQAYARSEHHDRPHYYAHVTTDGGYTILQYWYLYAMNDFRSTFGGVNDHEGDWEQVTIYLVPEASAEGGYRAAWIAASSHDEVGDDLRRRWDDPDLTLVGDHPVIFAGAGSHSSSFLQGEYVIGQPLPLPRWISRVTRPFTDSDDSKLLRIPYIDYKRGDGIGIGEGGDRAWTAVLVDESTPWVTEYPGLWGLDTEDPFGGERAPAGPRFNRDGTVRQSWVSPLAWSGLDKVPATAAEATQRITQIRDGLAERAAEAHRSLEDRREVLRGAYAAERALGIPVATPGPHVAQLDREVEVLRREAVQVSELLAGTERALATPIPDDPPHAHLRHRAVPLAVTELGQGRLLRVWAAASASLVLLVLGILMLNDAATVEALLLLAGGMIVIESVLRRRFIQLVAGAAVLALAVVVVWAVASIVLGNLQQGFGVLLILGAIYLGVSTLREAAR